MADKPKKRGSKKVREVLDMAGEVYDMSEKAIEHIRNNPDSRELCLLVMLLELWKMSVLDKKIDAVGMGVYGMQHFFDSAPEDCGKIDMKLIETPEGNAAIAIFPKDDPDPGSGKVKLN